MMDHSYITTKLRKIVEGKDEREMLVLFFSLKEQLIDLIEFFKEDDKVIRRIYLEFTDKLSNHTKMDHSHLFPLIAALREEVDLSKYHLFNTLFIDCERIRGELTGFVLPLVMSLSGKFTYKQMKNVTHFDDFFQEGLVGLLRAIDMYNPHIHEVKLSTYAYLKIQVMMQRYVANTIDTIRKPIHFEDISNKVNHFVARYCKTHGHRPSIDIIVNETDITEENVKMTFIHNSRMIDIDTPPTEDSYNWHDILPDAGAEDEIFRHLKAKEVHRLLLKLLPRHRLVLRKRFGIGCQELTLQEIGDEIGLTKTRIRNIVNQALRIFYGLLDTEAHIALYEDNLVPHDGRYFKKEEIAKDMEYYYEKTDGMETPYNYSNNKEPWEIINEE